MEALADAVGLRTLRFCPGVVNAFQVKIQRVFVLLAVAAVLAATVGQDTQQRYILFLILGRTRSLSMSAAVMACLWSYSLTIATLQ